MTKIAVISDGPKRGYAAMLPGVADALHVHSHEPPRTEGFARYEYVQDYAFVPDPELMTGRSASVDGSFTPLITDHEYDLGRTAGRTEPWLTAAPVEPAEEAAGTVAGEVTRP
ncbi:hypothetical protein ACIRD6_01950 [Streptomyces sp. NPDC102473]|uniref:hypothetical protein n=1 Tax=Streptomyces sp. NPDC102473 TaxID=3366180 RepID=UPI0038233354